MPFEDLHYSAPDGLKLHARRYGAAHAKERLPVVCLPGLTRNARDFHELALALSEDAVAPRMVLAFDYRGRGGSAYDPDWSHYNVVTEAEDVLAGLAAFGVEHAAFIGTSRGGLIMHVLAAMRPGVMKAGVLNDVGPVIEGDGLAQIRAIIERGPRPASWAEAGPVLKSIHGEAFPALSDADFGRMARAIYRDRDGKPVSDYDPNLNKTVTGLDLSKPLPEMWPQFAGLTAMPLLVIRGENSRLLSAATLEKMRANAPDLTAHTVAGQGHAPLLETAGLPQAIARFLAGAEKHAAPARS